MTLGPWRAGQPDTARLAALDNYPRLTGQRARLLWAMACVGELGATAHEAAAMAEIPRPHTASTRLSELAERGLVERTDDRRPSDLGSLAHVWRITPAGRGVAMDLAFGGAA